MEYDFNEKYALFNDTTTLPETLWLSSNLIVNQRWQREDEQWPTSQHGTKKHKAEETALAPIQVDLIGISRANRESANAELLPLYLVRRDNQLQRLLTFCGTSRTEIMRQYITYLLYDSSSSEYAKIHEQIRKTFNYELVKQHELGYYLDCGINGCIHREVQPTIAQLVATSIMHRNIEHQKENAWYKQVDGCIAQSFEEALKSVRNVSQ